MNFMFDLDISKCSACGACAIACMDQNDVDTSLGFPPLRRIFEAEHNGKYFYLSIACMHCEDAPCIRSCPSGCLRKDPATNFTIYMGEKCIACHSCAIACPFGIPSFGKDGTITKCDGCYIRVKYGLQPTCVLACPSGALSLCEQEQHFIGTKENSLKMIAHAQLIK